MLSIKEIMFLNSVAQEIQQMDDSEEIIDRLEAMKEEYKNKFE